MKSRILKVLLAITLTLPCLSPAIVFSQSSQSVAAVSEIPPGPSMKETEAWIKRELPKMGRDSVVEASGTLRVETNYEIAKATLTDCTLKLQSVSVTFGNSTSETATVTMKDLDLSLLVAVEASPRAGHTASKPSYVVRLVAQSTPNMPPPFSQLRTGYAGGPTTRSVAAVNVRLRDIGAANQVADVFRRGAVLCGAPDRPVDPAALVSCETIGSQVFCRRPIVSSGGNENVTAKPSPSGDTTSKMTNEDIIQLVKAGLSEQVIITSIRQAPTKDFDLTPTALIALKKASVPDAVIVVMQEKGTPERTPSASDAKTPPKYDATLAKPEKPTAPPASQDGCSGIESLGIYKNAVMDPAIGGGLVEWLAKIRNNTGVTKIVVFGWIDMYGQQKRAQVQIRGGDIASVRLDLTQARLISPVRDLRVLSCQ